MKIDTKTRFMRKVSVNEHGCWIWEAAIQRATGYGRFGITPRDVTYAHRAAWQLYRGLIPAGMYVCHVCDVRECVNPDHLFIGTQKDNMRDAARKHRVYIPRASYASSEIHQVAKLTDAQVREIREAEFHYRDTIHYAERFGVSPHTIWNARTQRTFKDVSCA